MQFGSLSSKTLLLRLSSSSATASPPRATSVVVACFSTSSSSLSSGAGSGSGYYPPRRPHHDEESRNVRVSVWWDFENCHLPASANVFKLAQSITAAVRSSGIKGPITITAFGDLLQLSRTNQEALSATGITLTHVPQGGKNSADRSLIIDLLWWVSQNPPPVHLLLISGDRDFASILHKLRMNNYNILLASKDSAPGVLSSAATIVWDWNALAKGENVTAKHFNQPPDGPYHSWYGHYKVPLLDPFAATEQSSCVKVEELSESNSHSDSTARPIPKEVLEQIQVILSSYPKGASIGDLREELIKNKVPMDRNFFGYKKFSRFLLSMSDILKVYPVGDGRYFVRGITRKTPMRIGSSADLSASSDHKVTEKETDNAPSSKLNGDAEVANLLAEARKDDTLGKMQQNSTERDKHTKEEVQELEKSSHDSVLVSGQCVKAMDGPMTKDHMAPVAEDSEEGGFVQRLKRLWFGSSETGSAPSLEINLPSANELEGKGVVGVGKVEDKELKPSSQESNPMTQTSPSTSFESTEVAKANAFAENEKSMNAGFFNRIRKWLKSWGGNTTTNHEAIGTQELVDVNSQASVIFSKDSFWSDIKSFINSPRGYVVVTHSRTREAFAWNLQKEGPSCLKLLSEPDMLRLVDMLISEKKWIEQNPSVSLPFSVARVKGSSLSHSHATNGLRSIFLDSSKSAPQEKDGEKRSKNVAHAGVSVATTMDRKQPEISRGDVFADSQKLVKKIIQENPGGYNLGCFRKDFLETYGYHLDVQKLGYQKLQSLIQVMPGARIESGFIVPSTPAPDATLSRKCRQGDGSDSSFDELGPVAGADQNNASRKLPEYEPSISEDEDSDRETETALKEKDGEKKDMRGEDKDSSLIQILDSWYNRKEEEEENDDDDKKEKPEDMDETKVVQVRGSYGKKQKPTKIYSFVADSDGDSNKEKLIDGILGSLKKSSESKVQG